jgi:ABC-type nickel/cobalt efflux system permease component RcnA
MGRKGQEMATGMAMEMVTETALAAVSATETAMAPGEAETRAEAAPEMVTAMAPVGPRVMAMETDPAGKAAASPAAKTSW